MAEVAPAPSPAKAAKKTGPSVAELVIKAVSASKERGGVSLAAVKKALTAGGYDVEKNKARVKIAVKSLVTKGTLVQLKGTGASGSFKMNKNAEAVTVKKPTAKKAVKAKKPAAAKKPVAVTGFLAAAGFYGVAAKKVSAKKPAAAKKSPKKAKKPAVKKVPAKSPKKAAKSPKKVAKKPLEAKKAPAKKVAKPKTAKKAAPKKK